ncbi:MAG: phage portal protein [Actinomycetota bacterium]
MPDQLENLDTFSLDPDAAAAVQRMNLLAWELTQREHTISKRLDYYRGKHKLAYASPEFADYMGDRYSEFSDNWCAPVVNSPAERINPLGVRLDPSERSVDADLNRVWRANGADRGFSEAVVVTLAASRAFATVWGDPDDEDTPTVEFERPDQAIVTYDDMGRRKDGLKLWRDDLYEYATYHTRGKLWKFARLATMRDGRLRSGLVMPSTAVGGWQARIPDSDDTWPIDNPMGELALVELSNHSLLDRDNPLSDIDGVIAMQDAINLVWAYLLNALDYASLPQRIVTGSDVPQVPVLDDNGQVIGRRPVELDELLRDRILWVPNKDASAHEWTAADLESFSKVIERALEHIAAQTRTPPHYLIGKVQNVSAEALTAAETGLVSKTGERIVYLTPGVKTIYRLIALAKGDTDKADAVRDGTLRWADTQFRALGQKVDALHKLRDIGFPFRWLAEQYGLTQPEIDYVMRLRQQERDDELAGDPLVERMLRDLGRPGAQPGQPAEPAPAPAG